MPLMLLLACARYVAVTPDACDGLDGDRDGVVDEANDRDGDGYTPCDDPADCDDLDPGIHPFAVEACDGADGDCDGALPAIEADADGDGARVCDGDCDDTDATLNVLDADADGWTSCATDCDDLDPSRYPGAPEVCDGRDTDCDGGVDDACI